uniref:Endonuclease/exonuclease/phosphatase domain-containing protein n=1 Tax=Daphnia galeata TaxID=27404 RepID=A0A8J2RH20_9CRUS|nr:unnamed protein product [Daphnia galeata]
MPVSRSPSGPASSVLYHVFNNTKRLLARMPLSWPTLLFKVSIKLSSQIFFNPPRIVHPKAVNKSKRPLSTDSSQDELMLMSGPKKVRYEKLSSFTDGLELSQLDSLSKEEITSKLHAVLDFAKTQTERISKLEAELVDVKLAFADSMTLRYINQRSAPKAKLPSLDPALPAVPSYSQAVRGHQAPVLMASYASSAKPADRISLAGVEELLGSTGGGPIPASVRQKDDKIFVRLADPADLERAKSILETKAGPDKELMLRNSGLKGKIESVSQLFSKPGSQKGHIKILFNCKETRDIALAGGEGMATYKALVVLQTQAVVNAQALILLATVPVNRGSVLIVKELTNLTSSSKSRDFKSLKCLQINLRHSKIASASLAQVIFDLDIDLVLIQEPYAFSATHPVIPNVPTGYSTFHTLTKDHAYGSAIIARDLIATKFNLKNRHFDNHVACVELTTDDGPLYFCSLYLRPSEPAFFIIGYHNL